MDQNNKENINIQPCQNPLERKIFKNRRRKPEGEPETNTKLFQEIFNELDNIRKELTDKKQVLGEEYSQIMTENIKAYLQEMFNSKESRSIETTISFVGTQSKISYFQNNVQVSKRQENYSTKESKEIKFEKQKQIKKSSVYQSVLLQNTGKLKKYRY